MFVDLEPTVVDLEPTKYSSLLHLLLHSTLRMKTPRQSPSESGPLDLYFTFPSEWRSRILREPLRLRL